MPQTPGGNLGMQLGQLLFGAPADNSAYFKGQALGSLVNERMTAARKNRADAIIGEDRGQQRQNITPEAVTAAGYTPDQSALWSAILRSSANPSLSQLGSMQAPTTGAAMTDARDAFKSGNDGLGNRMLALASGKPLETTSITDGVAFDKFGAPAQPMATTPLGEADIGLKNAQAGASDAQANASNAHARLFGVQTAAGGFNSRIGAAAGLGDMTTTGLPDGVTGEDYLATLPPGMQGTVKAVVEGRYPVPTGRVAMSPQWQEIIRAANRVDPTLEAGNYPARAASMKDFTSGKSSQQIQSLNTLAGHLAEAASAADALGNRASPAWNRIANATQSMFGSPIENNFNRAANTAGSEFATLLKGGVPSVEEIREQRETLNPSQSPAQLHGALSTMAAQVEARLQALQEKANQGLGKGASKLQVVTPQSKAAFDRIRDNGGAAPAAAAVPARHAIGDIITHGGKQYRVIGGDPNDPDVELVQ